MEIDRGRNAKKTGDHIVLLDLVLAYQRYSSPSIHRTTAQLLLHCFHTRLRTVYTQVLPLLLLNNPASQHLCRFFLRQQITNTLHFSLLHKVIQIFVDRFLGGTNQPDDGSASLSITSRRITHTNALTKGGIVEHHVEQGLVADLRPCEFRRVCHDIVKQMLCQQRLVAQRKQVALIEKEAQTQPTFLGEGESYTSVFSEAVRFQKAWITSAAS